MREYLQRLNDFLFAFLFVVALLRSGFEHEFLDGLTRRDGSRGQVLDFLQSVLQLLLLVLPVLTLLYQVEVAIEGVWRQIPLPVVLHSRSESRFSLFRRRLLFRGCVQRLCLHETLLARALQHCAHACLFVMVVLSFHHLKNFESIVIDEFASLFLKRVCQQFSAAHQFPLCLLLKPVNAILVFLDHILHPRVPLLFIFLVIIIVKPYSVIILFRQHLIIVTLKFLRINKSFLAFQTSVISLTFILLVLTPLIRLPFSLILHL